MRLYLDEDSINPPMIRMLRGAGHDVEFASNAGLLGRSDPVQLQHSIRSYRTLLSANHDDFEELHELVLEATGKHPGILIIRRNNDRRRDLTPRGIVTAITNLIAANVQVESQFIILNHWR